ncbi:MAG: branched-chain amino acid ABC transporter permease [Burkholderiaceae bacterium]
MTAIPRSAWAGALFFLVAAVALPAVAGGQWVKILTSTSCFVIAASGVAFMYARLGMVSLGQVALMGVGGWVMLRMNHAFALPFEINLAVAGAVTLVFGWLLALPALRMRGLYLALITLMAAGGLEVVFSTFRFPNGGEGFWGVMPSVAAPFRRPTLAQSDAAYLRYVIVVTMLGFVLIELHRRLAPGRAWALIRRGEAAALASGVNVVYYKAWAFGLSGFLAGIGGGLLAGGLGLLDPATFRASESIMLFALAVVGGARFWLGAVLAGVLYRVLPALFNDWGLDADLALVVFGAALLHAIITAPDGLSGQILSLFSKRPERT